MNNENTRTDRPDDDFEGMLRRFQFREPRPLPDVEPLPAIRRVMWRRAISAMAIAAAAVWLVVLWPSRKPAASRGSEALAVLQSTGERIESGRAVRSGDDAGAVLALADNSSIEMKAKSELSLERTADGFLVRLNSGSVIVSAAGQRSGHLYVETKDLRVSVVGTVFLVSTEETGSRVFVVHGEVEVRHGATLKNLLPGEQAASSATMQPTPLIEAIAWSRNAAAHMTLLQQVMVVPQTAYTSVPAPRVPRFEVAFIRSETRPGRSFLLCQGVDMSWGMNAATFDVPIGSCRGEHVTLAGLISGAYGIPARYISGGPSWLNSRDSAFQLEARAADASNPTTQQLRLMLRALLTDRFQLSLHMGVIETEGYVLLAGKQGLRLREALGNQHGVFFYTPAPGRSVYEVYDGAMPYLADLLGTLLHFPVLNNTGIAGTYDYTLTLDRGAGKSRKKGPPGEPEFDPPIPVAVEEQLGLHLEQQRIMVETVMVDRAEPLIER